MHLLDLLRLFLLHRLLWNLHRLRRVLRLCQLYLFLILLPLILLLLLPLMLLLLLLRLLLLLLLLLMLLLYYHPLIMKTRNTKRDAALTLCLLGMLTQHQQNHHMNDSNQDSIHTDMDTDSDSHRRRNLVPRQWFHTDSI